MARSTLESRVAEEAKLRVLIALDCLVRGGTAEWGDAATDGRHLRFATGERFQIEREGIKRIR